MEDAVLPGRVIVAGSLNADLVLRVDRLPSAGQTVHALDWARGSGGKGLNQAVAAADAGAAVKLIGCVGGDADGRALVATAVGHGIDVTSIRVEPAIESGLAAVAVDDHGANAIVVVAGANQHLGVDDVRAVRVRPGDVLVAQGEIPLEVTEAFFVAGRAAGARTVLNLAPFRPPSPALLAATAVLVVNEVELLDLAEWCGGHGARLDGFGVVEAVSGLLTAGPEALVLTLGAAGAVLVSAEGIVVVPGHQVHVTDSTGAGDGFTGVLAAELACGAELAAAMVRANDAASLVVQRSGAASAMPTRAEIDAVGSRA
jgi:ribokinase